MEDINALVAEANLRAVQNELNKLVERVEDLEVYKRNIRINEIVDENEPVKDYSLFYVNLMNNDVERVIYIGDYDKADASIDGRVVVDYGAKFDAKEYLKYVSNTNYNEYILIRDNRTKNK